MGDRDEAVAHWRDMLRLGPNEYEEPHFAEWSYTDALLKFKQGGSTSGATKALAAATKNNPHVPACLLGERRLPKQPPAHSALGSKEETVLYVLSSGETWTSTKGALTLGPCPD